jgi:hypothetical protein
MGVEFLIFAVFVLIVCALLVYAVQQLPLGLPAPFTSIIIVLIILIAIVILAKRAGVF